MPPACFTSWRPEQQHTERGIVSFTPLGVTSNQVEVTPPPMTCAQMKLWCSFNSRCRRNTDGASSSRLRARSTGLPK